MNNRQQEKVLFTGLALSAVLTGVFAFMNNSAGRAANPQPSVAQAGSSGAAVVEAVPVLVAETGTGIKVTKSSDWEEKYPNQFSTYAMNDENAEHHSYIEQHPYIATLYSGYGFAIQYESARGHTYVIEDVTSTGRPHKLANCFTCKTSDFTAKALNEGDSAYAMAFEDMEAEITDAFGCFHCHQNEPGTLYVTHTYLADALGDDLAAQDMRTLTCAQCHSEYYFDPETKATTLGYVGHDNATPDAILDYYNNLKDAEGNPYADWVDETTGVRKLKTQHPEFETISASGGIHPDISCVTCHMGKQTAADGTEFTNHNWTSPLDNAALLESSCNTCHGDLASQVEAIQKETIARTDAIGEGLAQANIDLAAAVEAGTLSEPDLAKARELARTAQWYWDFVFVENSNGVHNKTLTADCLDKAEKYLGELTELIGA